MSTFIQMLIALVLSNLGITGEVENPLTVDRSQFHIERELCFGELLGAGKVNEDEKCKDPFKRCKK